MKGQIISWGSIAASDYDSQLKYWNAIVEHIRSTNAYQLVIEDYLLYNHQGSSAATQSGSSLETPQLLGVLKYMFKDIYTPYFQRAVDVKNRWSDTILCKMNILEQKGNRYYRRGEVIRDDERSALRHFMHYIKFNWKKDSIWQNTNND